MYEFMNPVFELADPVLHVVRMSHVKRFVKYKRQK